MTRKEICLRCIDESLAKRRPLQTNGSLYVGFRNAADGIACPSVMVRLGHRKCPYELELTVVEHQ